MSGVPLERVSPTPGPDSPLVSSLGDGSAGHGAGSDLEPAHHGTVVSYNPDAPSEEWGWHGHWSDFAPRGKLLLLGLGVVGCLLLLLGNHVSNVENYYLVLTAAIMSAWMAYSWRRHQRAKRIKP